MTLLGLSGLAAAVAAGAFGPLEALLGSPNDGVRWSTAAEVRLPVIVLARGDLESAKNTDVVCRVEGQSTILEIKPEGTLVKKGEVVCVLDSALLRDTLNAQEIATKQAENDVHVARQTREVAEKAVEEYLDGNYPQLEWSLSKQIEIAKSELRQAKHTVDWSDRMFGIGLVTPSQNRANLLAYQKAEFSLREARTKLNVLKYYTRRKTLTDLRAGVDKARSDELAKQSVFELNKVKEEKLRTQIANCTMRAPSDGLVVYANDQNQGLGGSQSVIEPGATVRERQPIIRLPDLSQMRVNAKVEEPLIDEVRPGLRARIRLDAVPGQVLEGEVESVRPLADPINYRRGVPGTEVPLYTTLVRIHGSSAGLRPGMTAQVELIVDQPQTLVVPVRAILQYHGRNHVYVRTPRGPERRVVEIGVTDCKLVEIKQGLSAGDAVALQPVALMSDAERREVFAVGVEPEPWDIQTTGIRSQSQPPSPPPDFTDSTVSSRAG